MTQINKTEILALGPPSTCNILELGARGEISTTPAFEEYSLGKMTISYEVAFVHRYKNYAILFYYSQNAWVQSLSDPTDCFETKLILRSTTGRRNEWMNISRNVLLRDNLLHLVLVEAKGLTIIDMDQLISGKGEYETPAALTTDVTDFTFSGPLVVSLTEQGLLKTHKKKSEVRSVELPKKTAEATDFIYHTILGTEKDLIVTSGSVTLMIIEYHLLDRFLRIRSTLTYTIDNRNDQYIHQMNVVTSRRVRLIVGTSLHLNMDLIMIKNHRLVTIQSRLKIYNTAMYQFKTLADQVIVHGWTKKAIHLKLASC